MIFSGPKSTTCALVNAATAIWIAFFFLRVASTNEKVPK